MVKRMMDSTKMIYHLDRVKDFYEKGKKVSPILINIGVTKMCNLDCCYCFGVKQGRDQKSMIQRKPLLRLFEQASKLEIKAMEIIGDGEPTINPHIYDAMDIGKKNGLDMAFGTNGILLDTDEKRENILRNCKWMRINLSAGNREQYKQIHRRDYFDKLIKNIERLVELKKEKGYKCDIGLQAVFVPDLMNQHMLDESDLAVKLGVDYFVIKQCSLPEGNTKVADVEFDVNRYDDEDIQNLLKKCEAKSTDKTEIIPKYKAISLKGNRPYDHCVDVPFLFQVSGNGKCYPCGYLFGDERYEYGDLNKQSLKEILESDRYWKIVNYMINEFDVHTQCAGHCRHDSSNKFVWDYLNKPESINFI